MFTIYGKSLTEKVACIPIKRAGGWCEPAGVYCGFRSRDAGDEPDRRTGYRAWSRTGSIRSTRVVPRVMPLVPDLVQGWEVFYFEDCEYD